MKKGTRNRKRRQFRQARRAERRAQAERRATEADHRQGRREPRRFFYLRGRRGDAARLTLDFRHGPVLPFDMERDQPDRVKERLDELRQREEEAPAHPSTVQ